MVGAMAMPMAANTISYQGQGLFSETKRSLKMKLVTNSNMASSFLDVGWYARVICSSCTNKKPKSVSKSIVSELGGQYEEGFSDVKLVPFFKSLSLISPVHITFS